MDSQEVRCGMDWIDLAQNVEFHAKINLNRDRRRALANGVMNHRVP